MWCTSVGKADNRFQAYYRYLQSLWRETNHIPVKKDIGQSDNDVSGYYISGPHDLKQKTKIKMAKDSKYEWLDLYEIAPYPYNLHTDVHGRIMDAEYYDQLREDYQTDDTSDAFDGDPEAYWNID